MLKPRRPELLALIVAVYIALALNQPFWRKFIDVVAPRDVSDWFYVGAAAIAIVLFAYVALLALSAKPLLRAIILVLLPVTAAATYFMNEYGVVIDAQMVRNVFETDTREAGDLITFKLVAYIAFLGLLPAVLFSLVPWTKRPWRDEAIAKLKVAGFSLAVSIAAILPFWGNFLSLAREHRELKMMLTR